MSDLSGVTPQDIRDAAFGFTIPTGNDAALQRLIDTAEIELASKIPNLVARIASNEIDRATVASVIEDMVLRVANPAAGKKSERIDDYAYTVDDRVAAGWLFVTDAELARILPASQFRHGFGSIRLAVPSWRLPR